MAIDNEKAVWANVGDSRLYYIHQSQLTAITNDHSVAFKKYKAGGITRDQMCTDEEVLIDFLKSENARQWAENLLLRIISRIDSDNDNLSLLTLMIAP